MRAALLLLLLLAPAASAAPACRADVCTDESKWGSTDCTGLGGGWTDAKWRNVLVGFPITLRAHGERSCSSASRSDWLLVGATAGRYAEANLTWTSTSSSGARYMQANVTLLQTEETRAWWYGDTTRCSVESVTEAGATRVSDRRACPPDARPLPVVPLAWGNLLP